VKNLDNGAVTHTLHMTEAEVKQFITPLTKEKDTKA
jgi:acylphosphatase